MGRITPGAAWGKRGKPAPAAAAGGRGSLELTAGRYPARSSRQEKAMLTHPSITQAIAEEHRRDLSTQADARRVARGCSRPSSQMSRPARPGWRAVTAALVVVAALALLALTGPAHGYAGHLLGAHLVSAHFFRADVPSVHLR